MPHRQSYGLARCNSEHLVIENFDDDDDDGSFVTSGAHDSSDDTIFSSCCRRFWHIFFVDLEPSVLGDKPLQLQLTDGKASAQSRPELQRLCYAKPLGFGNTQTAAEVNNMYVGTKLEDRLHSIIFVLKLGLALVSYGYCTVDVEALLLEVCDAVALPVKILEVGHYHLKATFGNGPTHMLMHDSSLQCDKLIACVQLAHHFSAGPVDGPAALILLDSIIEHRKPYSPLVHKIAFAALSILASMSLRMGSYEDAVCTALVLPFVMLTIEFCNRFDTFREVAPFAVSAAAGAGASIVWRFLKTDGQSCQVPNWYLSVLLMFLPGSQIVYGVYEFEFNAAINGTSRIVKALLQCMVLAVGLICGWQVCGRNLMALELEGKTGSIASLPPAIECWDLAINQERFPTYFGVLNLPLLFFMMICFNYRVKQMLAPLIIAYLALLLFGAMSFLEPQSSIPAVVIDVSVVFFASTLGCFHEYFTGTPAVVSVLPVVMALAPGSGAVKSILQSVHRYHGNTVVVSDLWGSLVLEGLSYAVGLHMAIAMWRPRNFRQARERAAAALKSNGDKSDGTYGTFAGTAAEPAVVAV